MLAAIDFDEEEKLEDETERDYSCFKRLKTGVANSSYDANILHDRNKSTLSAWR